MAQDMETGQRGYLLTGEERYLEPYRNAKSIQPAINSALLSLVRDNPEQIAHVNRIQSVLQQRIAIIDKSIASMRAGRPDEARDIIKSGEGKAAMDQYRILIATAQQQEQDLFEKRQSSYQSQRQWLLGSLLAMLLGCAGLAMFSLAREKERVTALETTAQLLSQSNRTLENRVSERTSELAIERDRAEAERERAEALLRDVTHRIGNTLALVVGFINLHIRHARDPLSVKTLTGARSRIHAIASAQRRINVTSDLELVRIDDLIESVLSDLVAASGEESVKVDVQIPPLLAPAQSATSVCVLTQEFVMNSLKHGFPDGRRGTIVVTLERTDSAGAILSVFDDGVGLPPTPDKNGDDDAGQDGLGSKIATLLTRQFNGAITYAAAYPGSGSPGTKVVVTLSDLKLAHAENAAPPENLRLASVRDMPGRA